MSFMAVSIGVSVAVLRFLLRFIATIPVSFAWRFVPSRLGKHIYSAASGAFLSYLSFGFFSNLHFLVPMTIGYASMAIYRPMCGFITFFLGLSFPLADGYHQRTTFWFSRHWTVMNMFDKAPIVDKGAFVAPSASIIGNVQIGRGSSIWYG